MKDRCYKLHGFPTGYKNSRSNKGNNGYRKGLVNYVVLESNSPGQENTQGSSDQEVIQMSSTQKSSDQYDRLMTILNEGDIGGSQTARIMNAMGINDFGKSHLGGTFCLSSFKFQETDWIIDSGATDDITPYAHILKDVYVLDRPYIVIMPNGITVFVTHTETAKSVTPSRYLVSFLFLRYSLT